jgi:hypothetical protein
MAKTNSSVSKSGKSAEISAQEKIVQLKKDEIAADAEIARSAKRKLEHYESLQKAGTYLNDTAKKEIEFLKQDLKLQEDKEKALKTEQKLLSKLYETENKRKKLLKDSITDADEFASSLRSLGVQIGKDNKLFEAMNSHVDSVATTLNSVGQIVAELGDDQQNLKKQVIGATDAYKNLNNNITVAGKKMMQQKMTQSEYNQLIKDSYENFDEVISKIDQSTEAGKDLYKMMLASKNEMESFYKAAQKSEKTLTALNTGLDQLSSSGVPGVSELSNVIKSAAEGGKGLSLSIFALGAALGALAYNLGFVGDKIKDIAESEAILIPLRTQLSLLKNDIEGAFAGEEAAGRFAFEMQRMAVAFKTASKTALFGKGLGSVGYGAGQLQLAGIGAEQIASQMKAASDATGKMPSSKVAADMAVLAARTDQSAEGAATLNEMLMRMDGHTADTALNMQEGMRAMADKAGINLGGLMAEMAETSKDMLGYQIKSGSALARQVTFARSMGVSFQDIAKAGQSMVLNYKDSIKSEMQLSAMLGKNVDLSEVRAKFASGDTEGALKSLQAQGLDPAKMDMFQQQMLQQATGMDLTTLSKINKNTGKSVNLGEGNAKAGNQSFLNTKQNAELSQNISNANISVAEAAFNITMQGKKDLAVNNSAEVQALNKKILVEEAKRDAEIGLKTALYALLGGVVALTVAMGAQALFKGKMPNLNPFSNKGPKVPQPSGPLTKSGKPDMRFKANKTPSATGLVDDALEVGGKSVAKTAGKTAATTGVKGVAKVGAKAIGKSLLKKIPVVGLLAGVGFGLSRLMKGDYSGAAMELASGAAGTIPGIGTAASVGIDTALAAKDMGAFDSKAATPAKAGTPAKAAAVSTPTAVAATNAVTATGGASVVSAAKASEKWMQDKLTYMSGNLERVVDRTTKTMNNTAASLEQLKVLNTNTLAMKELTRKIEALTRAQYEGGTTVKIDGKILANAATKYQDNTTGMTGATSTKTTYG